MHLFHRLRLLVLVGGPVFAFAAPVRAQKPFREDKKLTRQLEKVMAGFHGVAGVYACRLRTGKGAAIRADTIFPTASTIKLTILSGIFDQISRGKLSYHQPLLYRDSLAYGGSGVMGNFKDSTAVDLSIPVTLMITYSDNTAALWCQSLAGGGTTINQWLAGHGFADTRVNSRTPGRASFFREYGWGQTTPREIAGLLTGIRTAKFFTPAISERMYRDLTHIYWDGNALSQFPPYVQSASKQGAVDAARSEVVLVNAPHGDYVFAVYTKDNQDQRWTPDNEASVLIRKVSATLWHYYEPHARWRPAPGMAQFEDAD